MNEGDKNPIIYLWPLAALIMVIFVIFGFVTFVNYVSAASVDPSIMKTESVPIFPWELISLHFGTNTFAQNESYMKLTFDGAMNEDQTTVNRGVDFSKCLGGDNSELADAVANDTHYQKIRGDTPDDALKTLSFPGTMLNTGFAIPDPDHLYASQFKQVSPDEYKIWVIVKTPTMATVDGALEQVCQVNYYY
jgi:hypothetical protein